MNAQTNSSVEAVHGDSETAFSIVDDLEPVIDRSNALLHTLMNIILAYEEGGGPGSDFESQRNAGLYNLVNLTIDQNQRDYDVASDKAREIGTAARVATAA